MGQKLCPLKLGSSFWQHAWVALLPAFNSGKPWFELRKFELSGAGLLYSLCAQRTARAGRNWTRRGRGCACRAGLGSTGTRRSLGRSPGKPGPRTPRPGAATPGEQRPTPEKPRTPSHGTRTAARPAPTASSPQSWAPAVERTVTWR